MLLYGIVVNYILGNVWELSGATHLYMNIVIKIYQEISIKSVTLGYQTWVPIVHPYLVSWGMGARGIHG